MKELFLWLILRKISEKRALKQLEALKNEIPLIRLAGEKWKTPFQTLISIILSARTRDEITIKVCKNLFDNFPTVEKLSKAKLKKIEKLINPINFYHNKSKNILNCAKEILERFLAIGFTVSFSGVITFTHDYDELIKLTPLNMIMAETDAPFAAPVPHRGVRNEPIYVEEVVKKIAETRGIPLKEMSSRIVENTQEVFGLQ